LMDFQLTPAVLGLFAFPIQMHTLDGVLKLEAYL
jgi:hypothetical protein